jgi:hypothetical protein
MGGANHQQAEAAVACPKQTCAAGYACGGQGGTFAPPGAMSMCTQSQNGAACNWCDGTTVVRLCIPSVQTRQCVSPATATTCGNPKKGICKKAYLPVVGTYYWCKSSGAAGTHSCSVISQCTSDKACPPVGG